MVAVQSGAGLPICTRDSVRTWLLSAGQKTPACWDRVGLIRLVKAKTEKTVFVRSDSNFIFFDFFSPIFIATSLDFDAFVYSVSST